MGKVTKEQEERLSLYSIYTILYMNDMACFSIQQIGKDVDLNNKECKKIYEALLKREKQYYRDIEKIVGDKIDYYCDYCTEMDAICDDAYFDFKQSIEEAYKNAGIDNYKYFAIMEVMRSIVELSTIAGQDVVNKVCVHVPSAKWMERYLLKDISRVANNLANWEYRKIDKSIKINFNQDSDVMKKFHKLSECLIDYESFDKSYRKSVELELKRKSENE